MAADGTPPSAEMVGIAFATQYYQMFSHSPQLLVRFYKEGSKLSRPDSRGEMSSVTGMDAINEKLLSVDYSEYSAEIKTVDAQELLNGCVNVLVTGYLNRNDGVKKMFGQYFLLATQDKGYYVLNDIFRFLDEANDQPSSCASTSGDTEPLAPEQAEQLEQHENQVPEEEKLDEAETVDPSAEISCSVKEEVQAGKEIDEVSKSFQAVALNPSSSTTLEKLPPRESYASIVKGMKKKPTPPVPSKLAVVNTDQPASPTSIPGLVTESASVNPNAVDSNSSPEPEVFGYSIHIKNLPLYVTPAQLEEEFKKFGPIKRGGIQIRSFQQNGFSFGFVDFEVADAVARAMEEVGDIHAQSVGFSTDGFATTPTMRKLGLIWATCRMHIEVYKYPSWGEVIVIETWCQSDGRMGTRRDWILKDFTTSEVIGRATSKWVTMNQNTWKLQRISDEVREEVFVHCPRTPRLSFPEANNGSLKNIPKLDVPAQYSRLGLVPRRADLDTNQHVNDVTYIRWVLDSIPQEIIDTYELQTITLDYRQECQRNDIVDSLASPEVPEDGCTNGAVTSHPHANDQVLKQFLHLLRLSGSGLEINRGRTVWKKLAR